LRFQLPANATCTDEYWKIHESTMKNKGTCFFPYRDYQTYIRLKLLFQLTFKNSNSLRAQSLENQVTQNLYNYPNPCTNSTTLVLPEETQSVNVKMDLLDVQCYPGQSTTVF
jgi:hypothetical protein